MEMDQYSGSPGKGDEIFMKIFKYYKTPVKLIDDPRTEALGLRNVTEWALYSFPDRPGLFLIRNPFTSLGQRFWIRKCLEEYPRKPGKSNIDIDGECTDWWKSCYENGKYTEENRNDFPEDLAELSDVIAQYLGCDGFKAEAAIVNYYHMNSTLSAHTDHSEEARLCYHAVPKIIPSNTCPWNEELFPVHCKIPAFKYITQQNNILEQINQNADNIEWRKFQNYIAQSRINMNLRQVLYKNQKSLSDSCCE
ncbi:Alkylated DNA repair protein alkB-like protein [Operophtera brumata]|uniref:Alkylated DNA repair protein alkB-like protein n=1 Tax=Operophtera brumata TaxID=104452 RepID=A0A0L7L0G7_OPEBR|nr:Alkylated DNA repair protein alkB-like protein [Operophtera brumata]